MANAKARANANAGDGPGGTDRLIVFSILLFLVVAGIYAVLQLGQPEQQAVPNHSNSSITFDRGQQSDFETCLKNNGISGSVIYIYSRSCAYSQENTPWINELNREGYKIEMIETSGGDMLAVYNCLSGIASFEGTPEYVCTKTNSTHLGAFSLKSEIVAFINGCK